jgi:transcription antitermination factor NusG
MADSVTQMAKLYPEAGPIAPPTLAADIPRLHEVFTPRWHVASTKSRHEKIVHEHFASRSLESFLPVYDSVRQWHDRRKRLQLPLFPGYIFVRVAYTERLRVLEVPGVSQLVKFGERPAVLYDDEMHRLRTALTLRHAVPHPSIAIGTRVRIVSGPLRGLCGVVQRERRPRLIISVDCLCRSVAVELDESELCALAREET